MMTERELLDLCEVLTEYEPDGWRVEFEYPGVIAWSAVVGGPRLLATPDWDEPGTLPVEWHDEHGGSVALRVHRLTWPQDAFGRARAYFALIGDLFATRGCHVVEPLPGK